MNEGKSKNPKLGIPPERNDKRIVRNSEKRHQMRKTVPNEKKIKRTKHFLGGEKERPISWGVCCDGWQLRMPTFHTIVHRRENLLSTESTRCEVRKKQKMGGTRRRKTINKKKKGRIRFCVVNLEKEKREISSPLFFLSFSGWLWHVIMRG